MESEWTCQIWNSQMATSLCCHYKC